MRSDGDLDREIKLLEQRIRDRRVALRSKWRGIEDSVHSAKERVRSKAASPALFAGALLVGFIAARAARRMRKPQRKRARVHPHLVWTADKEPPRASTAKQVLAGAVSIAVPIALRLAQRQAVPLIERALHAYTRRRDGARYRATH
jgi:hypothetical protein